MIVTKHAGLNYKARIAVQGCERWGKDYTIRRVLEHLEQCRPATELEMFYIRKTKRRDPTTTDRANATHYIDPNNHWVFVVAPDKETNEPTIITCYQAPYLQATQNPKEQEQQRILDAFHRAGQENSCMRWAVGLYYLQQDGFQITFHNIDRTLTTQTAKGILILQTPTDTNKQPKILNGGFHEITWRNRKLWNFRDLDINSPDQFDTKFQKANP